MLEFKEHIYELANDMIDGEINADADSFDGFDAEELAYFVFTMKDLLMEVEPSDVLFERLKKVVISLPAIYSCALWNSILYTPDFKPFCLHAGEDKEFCNYIRGIYYHGLGLRGEHSNGP